MTISDYINRLNTRYKSGISKEHAYRTDLENLIRELVSGIEITNEPANVTDCGNPDYVITRKKIPVGYIEAKDIGKDLNAAVFKEQFTRYRKALDNLIITDYLWFRFFRNGQLIHEIRIGEPDGKKINPLAENFEQFERLIKDFCAFVGQTIKSGKKLAAKARLLDYIYAVLHSPAYREKYKEFLKIDFPRVPYPTNPKTFWQLAELGGELRQIHLLESPKVKEFITSYPIDGNNTVTRKMTTKSLGWEASNAEKTLGRVWINDTQYFGGVPLTAWEFYIGGYQPAQKWLKDRHGRTLSFDDILHYQKIIVALTETYRLMQEVDEVGVERN
jgi:hypothetical protein